MQECQSCNLLAIAMMMMMVGYHTTTAMAKPTNATSQQTVIQIVRFINTTLQLKCSLVDNSTHLVSWTKDGVNLTYTGSKLIIDDKNGWLTFAYLERNDSGIYTCITNDSNGIIKKSISLKVIGKSRTSSPFDGSELDVTRVKLSARLYSLPDWMTGVACVVLIAMVTIIIIVAYVKMTTPKKGDLSKRFATPKEELEAEVVPDSNSAIVEKERGFIRQRKSTSSSPPSSQEDSFLNESPKYCSSRKEKPNDQDLGVGRAALPASQQVVKKNLEMEKKPLRKIQSDPCNVISKDVKDFAIFMAYHSQIDKNNNPQKVLKVRSDPELTGNTPERKTSPEISPKHHRSPGKKLRKMVSESYCRVSAKYASNSNSKMTEGQALRKVSSEPARRVGTIYSRPIIKPSLGYDKNALYAKVHKKLKKAKSDRSINKPTTQIGHGDITKKTKRSRKTDMQATELNYSNPFYASIEDITTFPTDKECLEKKEDDDDPVYRDSSDFIHPSFMIDDSKTSHTQSDGSIVKRKDYVKAYDVVKDLKHEKQIENLGFSFSEDLEGFDESFDEEPNSVIDRIYENIGEIDINYPIRVNYVRELPQLPNDSTDEESLYEEIYCSKA